MDQTFADMWQALCGTSSPESAFREVKHAYAESHRRYHTLEHISDCFAQFDPDEANDAGAVAAALWFHDVVYDTKQPDNEEQSAKWATRALTQGGANSQTVARVADLIVATKHHVTKGAPDAALLVDIDLSILGRSPEVFDEYDRRIREEYAWVPDEQYVAARRAVLAGFLNRECIYATKRFRSAYERQARENLQRMLNTLHLKT